MHARFWLLSGFLTTGMHASLLAQDVAGNLEGWVTDTAGAPAPSAQVTVQGSGLPLGRVATVSSEGHFRIAQLPVGAYDVKVRAIGHRSVTLEHVGVTLGATAQAAACPGEPARPQPQLSAADGVPAGDGRAPRGRAQLLSVVTRRRLPCGVR
jgi:hypothetical protein